MDGSSHSVGIDETGFHVTGHNYEYKDDGNSPFYELVKSMDLQAKMEAFAAANNLSTFTIQGELCAPGIQKNRLKLTKPAWYVFTIREPIEEIGTDLPTKYPTVEDLLERADGNYPKGGKKEGIVIRPTEPVYCELISGALSMKVVNNKYLLKND